MSSNQQPWRVLDFRTDERGELIVAEAGRHVPFPIERVFVVRGIPAGARRGGHAHRTTTELFFCTEGGVLLSLEHNDRSETIVLDTPRKAVVIRPRTWIVYEGLVDGSSCTVLASTRYAESDYIRRREDI